MNEGVYALVITPHPDDAEFGVAGTVAKWTSQGKEVIYTVCTNGDKGTSDREMKPEVLQKIREKEQKEAARVLGVQDVVFLGYPDQGLEDNDGFRKAIVRLIRIYRPQVVVTVDPYRRYVWHRDHRITGQVVLDAVFPYARDHLSYPDLLEENLQPHKVKELLFWASQEPNYWTDITATYDLKEKALFCHESQVGGSRVQEIKKWLKNRGLEAAKGKGYQLAEAFHKVQLPE